VVYYLSGKRRKPMNKLIPGIFILLLIVLLGCSPQPETQTPEPSVPPQPTEVVPPSQDNTETSVTATVVEPTSKIAFVRDLGGDLGWDIFTANADGTNVIDITNSTSQDSWPSWSPDGTQIVFESGHSICKMAYNGNNKIDLTGGSQPSWSPAGDTMAYSTWKLGGGATDIFVMDASGNNQRAVAPIMRTPTSGQLASQVSASWFPDNNNIAYTSNNYGPWEICEITIDNPPPNFLTPDISESKRYHICINNKCGLPFPVDNIAYHLTFPSLAVSPDGKTIAFDYCDPITFRRDIYLFTIDTGEVKCLTCELHTNCYFPTWSPDGTKIAFTMETAGDTLANIKTDIYIMDADGGNPRLLIKDGMFPSWLRK
jgi:Tol biopolymer transport system component